MVALHGKFLLLHVSNHEYLYENKQNLLPSPRTQRVVCLQEEVKILKKILCFTQGGTPRFAEVTVTRPQCKTSPGVQALLSSLSRGLILTSAKYNSWLRAPNGKRPCSERLSHAPNNSTYILYIYSTSNYVWLRVALLVSVLKDRRTLASCTCSLQTFFRTYICPLQ